MNIQDLIKCVSREIKMRKRVYPRLVGQEAMEQSQADHEIKAMEEVLQILNEIADKNQGKLF